MNIKLRIIGCLLLAAVWSSAVAVREKAAGDGPDIPDLIDRLGTRNWDAAVEALAGIGEPAVGPLIDALDRNDRFIPGRACIALARIGTPAAVKAVYGAFRSPNLRAKDDVVSALALLRTETSESLLVEALGDGALRHSAIQAVGVLGSRRAVSPLIVILKEGAWYHREAASRALGVIGSAGAVPALLEALADRTRSVRSASRTALAAIAGPAFAPLRAALAGSPPAVRWQIVWILGRINGEDVPGILVESLKDADWMVRTEAAVALAGLKDAGTEECLIRLLSDPDARARTEAAWVLGELGTERALKPLSGLLRDGDSGWMAAAALGRIGSRAAADPLINALRTGPARTRRGAAFALSRVDSPKTAEALSRAAKDADEEVRFWAAEALRRAASADATPDERTGSPVRPDRSAPQSGRISFGDRSYPIYPETMDVKPDLPSPWAAGDGREYVAALTRTGKWAVIPVTPEDADEARRQAYIDTGDFTALARRGIHSGIELGRTRTITGRSVAEITDLGRPGGLSTEGFLSDREDILGVLAADNRSVSRLGLTHPELARPLFHIWNMILADTRRNNWNMTTHRWDRLQYLLFNGHEVLLDAGDTKGGQKSIFDDGLEGSFGIEIRRDWAPREEAFLRERYAHLPSDRLEAMKRTLSCLRIGEMEAYYIQWYGFYEGHTSWRAEPLAIAFIFGLKSIEEIERAFPGDLERALLEDFVD